jgi:hypothetical protein
MKLVTIKNANEVKLAGITCEFETRDGAMRSVTLRDAEGNMLRVAHADYAMHVLRVAPVKMVKRFRLTGKLLGVADVNEDFETEYAARERLQEIERGAGYEASEKLGLKIEAAEVPEPDGAL